MNIPFPWFINITVRNFAFNETNAFGRNKFKKKVALLAWLCWISYVLGMVLRAKTPCCLSDSEVLLMLSRVVLLPLVMLLMLGGKLEVQKMILEVDLLVLLMMFIVELLLMMLMLLNCKLLLLARVGRTVKVKRVERPTNSQHSSNNKSTRCRVNKLLCLQT